MKTHSQPYAFDRPYLVIPKLIEQPTWGGDYIVHAKGWSNRPGHDIKIGQSYELFSGSNLSLLDSSDHPNFVGELTDRDAAQIQTRPDNSIALSDMIAADPAAVLGKSIASERGNRINLLAKFTQALGNSFQVHITTTTTHPKWIPKPESWYYFEPGVLTLGVKPNADWNAYKSAVLNIHEEMQALSQLVQSGALHRRDAQAKIETIIKQYDPWQYVNTVHVEKGQLVDLSSGGIHHSWEEDATYAPHGNILYELQSEAMDDIATIRSFDKGKMGPDGAIRDVHIQDYFDVIDQTPETNNPATHMRHAKTISETASHKHEQLMESPYYGLDSIILRQPQASIHNTTQQFRHLFVQRGRVAVTANSHTVTVRSGHSCFIPAATGTYEIKSLDESSKVLVSY